jgi:tetratricopeptide repeat protein
MKQKPWALAFLFTLSSVATPANSSAQANNAAQSNPPETQQDLIAKLNPQQKQQFDAAAKAFNGKQYTDAIAAYKQLLGELPGDAVLSKFASEAALNSGDPSYALNAMKPIAQADPDDWQAAALLTRACAESGDASCRDAGIAHMLELHARGITPRNMQQYIVEQVKVGENFLLIRTSLEPWGPYKVYALGQVMDTEGKIFLRATVESNDTDQRLFAKEHPDEAAKGMRRFSLDSYQETGLNSGGQRTQTHATYKFFVGQPSYEVVREEFLKIAAGKAPTLSSRPNLVVP